MARPRRHRAAGGRGHRARRLSAQPGARPTTGWTRCAGASCSARRPRAGGPPGGAARDRRCAGSCGRWRATARSRRSGAPSSIYDDIERPLVPVLAEMERHGIRVEPARLEEFSRGAGAQLDSLTREIYELAGERVQHRLAQAARQDPVREAEAAGAPEDQDRLLDRRRRARAARRSATRCPRKILEHRELAKLKGTYVDALPLLVNPRDRAHPHLVQPARGGDGPAVVERSEPAEHPDPHRAGPAHPRGVRRRRRAWRFVAADYSQIELRILAHVSGEREPGRGVPARRGHPHAARPAEVFERRAGRGDARSSATSPRRINFAHHLRRDAPSGSRAGSTSTQKQAQRVHRRSTSPRIRR